MLQMQSVSYFQDSIPVFSLQKYSQVCDRTVCLFCHLNRHWPSWQRQLTQLLHCHTINTTAAPVQIHCCKSYFVTMHDMFLGVLKITLWKLCINFIMDSCVMGRDYYIAGKVVPMTVSHLKRLASSAPPVCEPHILHNFRMLVHLSTSQSTLTTRHFNQIQETYAIFCLTCMWGILIIIWLIFHYIRELGTYPQILKHQHILSEHQLCHSCVLCTCFSLTDLQVSIHFHSPLVPELNSRCDPKQTII
jgi:hypothetical protein